MKMVESRCGIVRSECEYKEQMLAERNFRAKYK